MVNRSLKRDWVLNEDSFNRLLEALDPNHQRAAEQYEHLRRSLIRYFDWRGSIHSEKDADDTIDRLARKLCEGRDVLDVYTYALGVARNVAFESLRLQKKEQALPDVPPLLTSDPQADEDFNSRSDCFESCLAQMPAAKRNLILAYYEGDKGTKIVNRQKLADAAGIPMGRLRIQAHRIREKLEHCIDQCLSSEIGDDAG